MHPKRVATVWISLLLFLPLAVLLETCAKAEAPLQITSCTYYGTIANDHRGSGLFVFEVTLLNTSKTAVDEAIFYIRSKSPKRTVPDKETVELVEIEGGVEPNEELDYKFSILARRLGARNELFPPKNPVEIAVVDSYPEQGKKPYIVFKGLKMTPAKHRHQRDPNLDTFLNLQMSPNPTPRR